jgi:hypothetical protein
MPAKMTITGFTLPFEKFWTWIQAHPNCILRAGTPEVALFDDDDFHWHFTSEDDGTQVVQVIRGKKLLGEIAITPGEVSYVQAEPGEGEEFRFDLVTEGDQDRVVAYHFVLSHGYDDGDVDEGKRFTH